MKFHIRTPCGSLCDVDIADSATFSSLTEQVRDKTGIDSSFQLERDGHRVLLSGKDSVQHSNLRSGDVLDVVVQPLSCRKPIILFYLPRTGPFARVPTINVTVNVTLHPSCHFTMIIPRPEVAPDGHSLTWKAGIHRRKALADADEATIARDDSSAMVCVNGHDRSYLFWEFETAKPPLPAVEAVMGYRSLLDHAEDAYLMTSESEYEEWCQGILELFGLGVVERDDFVTFWAGNVVEAGAVVVARIIPMTELATVTELKVKATTEDAEGEKEVPVSVKRVFVTMVACSRLPKELEAVKDQLRRWKAGTTMADVPEELQKDFPIVKDPGSMSVLEWGGMLLYR